MERKSYEHFGVMLDCSRNAVMKPQQVMKMIDYLVKLGYNTLELYCEDTLEVSGEPYFGYLRGRYTADEIKAIDAYAAERGVELIPCVQTLAHYTNAVKNERFYEITDVNDILLIDDEKTYEFLDRVFASLAANFTSRHVNIGMDEAHMVGLGRYLDLHGFSDRFEILNRHLRRVAEICEKYGFKPHMWSDMFFRLMLHGEYHGKGLHVPKEVRDSVPENVELTYWDYYSWDADLYDEMFKSHEEFGREIWFAGGAWCWNGFAPLHSVSFRSMKPAMLNVEKHRIKHVLITMWGDNGKECSFFSLLPTLYAIRRYADGVNDDAQIRREFDKQFDLKFDDFMLLELPNLRKGKETMDRIEDPCKSLLYNDCFLGLLDTEVERAGEIPYGEYAQKIAEAIPRAGEFGYIFDTLSKLCSALELKYDLGVRTRRAYKSGDKNQVKQIAADYRETVRRVEIFYQAFAALWQRENKPFGFEVQDIRFGGLIQRLKSCQARLELYADGKLEKIEELEENILDLRKDGNFQHNFYRHLVTPSEL